MILSTKQIAQLEKRYDINQLIINAGRAIFDEISNNFSKRKIIILCGPGNNGEDGIAAAKLFIENHWDIKVFFYKRPANAKVKSIELNKESLVKNTEKDDLFIDSLFGTGLSRNIQEDLIDCIKIINTRNVISIDVPTGINTDTGAIMGYAVQAKTTITFHTKKPCHLLLPGKEYSGKCVVKNIGIKDKIDSKINENNPLLWDIPKIPMDHNKYDRGHCITVAENVTHIGATKMSAIASLRSGSGMSTILTNQSLMSIYASSLMSIMVRDIVDLKKLLNDGYTKSVIIGPGSKLNEQTKKTTISVLKSKKKCVIDAGSLSVFENNSEELFKYISDNCAVMTPHEWEFRRLFKFTGNKIERTLLAARASNSTILLKGSDTVIASPEGNIVINSNAPSYLATAGSGDVLSGIIGGLMASGMSPFNSACAGAWIHSECAKLLKRGMIAEDLLNVIPEVISKL